MPELHKDTRIRFDVFEFDLNTRELLKNGHPVRLQGQPARVLGLMASRPGELISRAEIQKELWPDGRFVEFEHAINTAVKKVREALEDDPNKPKFIETLPKLGYRFIAPLEEATTSRPPQPETVPQTISNNKDEFSIPYPRLSRFLLLAIQAGYLAMYCSALFYMPELDNALTAAGFVPVSWTFPAVLVLAMCGIAVRLYLLTAVGWRHPAAGAKFATLFPFILVLDALWAASPLLVIDVLGSGVALAGVAGLAYLPFAQRTLIQSVYKSAGSGEPGDD
jgi:cholera toxin transcriptional activator